MAVSGSVPTHSGRLQSSNPGNPAEKPAAGEISIGPAGSPPVSPLTEAIARHQKLLFILCGLLLLASFNGQWRIGTDSSHYRGLANALATGRGYDFGEFATTTVYPGLPLLLAGAQKAFGLNVTAPWQSVLMILLMGVGSLFVVYRLIRLSYPAWIATAVTCGVAVNSRFVQLCHELLTDVPFFLGLVCALLGWELLRRADSKSACVRATVIATAGLLLAASMRPTFWVLALAWLAVGVYELFRPDRRRAAAISLVAMIGVIVTAVSLDPRTRGLRLFDGGYEQEFLAVWADAGADYDTRSPAIMSRLAENLPKLLGENFPEAFLGQGFPWGINFLFAAILLIAGITLFRRHPLWALTLLGTVAVTLMLSTSPRYYLMVLPMLLVGWINLLLWVGRKTGPRAAEVVLFVGLGLVTCMNLGKALPFLLGQRETPFQQRYRDGKFLPFFAMAEQIRKHVAPDERMVGPNSPVLRFLSDRQVMMEREVLSPRKSPKLYPKELLKEGLSWAVFPADPYREKESELARMIDRRIIRSTGTVAEAGGWRLARISIVVPPVDDWRTIPLEVARRPTTKRAVPKKTPEQLAAIERRKVRERKAAAAAREARARAERKAAVARRLDRERKQAAAEKKAIQERRAAAARRAAAEAKAARAAREARALKEEKARKRAAAEAKAAKARKARKAATSPATQPTGRASPSPLPYASHRDLEFLRRVYVSLASVG